MTVSSGGHPAGKAGPAPAVRHRVGRDDTISPGEAARLLGVSPRTLRDWSKKGRLTFTLTLGGHRRYHRTDILFLRSALAPRSGPTSSAGSPGEIQELLGRIALRLQTVRRACPGGVARRETVLMEEELLRARTIIHELLRPDDRHRVT